MGSYSNFLLQSNELKSTFPSVIILKTLLDILDPSFYQDIRYVERVCHGIMGKMGYKKYERQINRTKVKQDNV